MNEHNTIIEIILYNIELNDEPKKTTEVEDFFWFGKNDDVNILGPIDRNFLIPRLIEMKLLD